MNREEAKELLPIMKAYAEGKTIQSKQINAPDKEWRDIEEYNFLREHSYRIKTEPKYRPFRTQEECWDEMHKHPDFGWVVRKETGNYAAVVSVTNYNIMFQNDIVYSYNKMMDNYTFTDGEPFGIKEE